MDEKMAFISALRAGESMSELCRRHGVSRKTGYKWKARFEEHGIDGLKDRGRAPSRHPNETPDDVVEEILDLRRAHPRWGPRKLVAWLVRHEPELAVPCASTVGVILKRNGLVRARRRKPKPPRYNGALTAGEAPNQVWTADFKGQFRVGNGRMCWPLTIGDLSSRYLLCCQGLRSVETRVAMPVFISTLREFGLPSVLRTDNGVPFAGRAPGGLTELGVLLVKLGIKLERIEPGHPEQNGAHERMHRTLKAETTQPPEGSMTAQQRRFSRFLRDYNEQRPHEALEMLTPADLYVPSPRPFPRRLAPPEYEEAEVVRQVHHTGQAQFGGRHIYCGRNLGGEYVAMRQVGEQIWSVRFYEHPLGEIDFRDTTMRGLRPQ